MTNTQQPETKSSSRRALLAGALGGIGAWAASAVGRASPVHAEGEVIHVGDEWTTATSKTKIANLANSATVLEVESNSGVGLLSNCASSIGIQSASGSNIGVLAASGSHIGLYAYSNATDNPASVGWSVGNSTGVQGYSGTASLPAPRPKTGVYGYANQDIYSTGTYGLSPLGVGVRGKTTSGYAGYFEGRVYTNAWYELGEVGTPAAPLANRARLFVRDNGAGKTQLCVRFHTGSVQVIKTEP
jgi:hypothetical protein